MMEIYIVDKEDNVVARKDIRTVDWPNDIYRTASLLLKNSKAEVLLAQRAYNKIQSPGLWSDSASGIVESHETYESNILNETYEELGIELAANELIEGPKVFSHREDPPRHYFMQYYFAVRDIPIEAVQIEEEEEVADIAWAPIEELQNDLQTHPERYVDLSVEILDALKEA